MNCVYFETNNNHCLVCFTTKKGVCYDFDIWKAVNSDWSISTYQREDLN
jgi:hypothetical protein